MTEEETRLGFDFTSYMMISELKWPTKSEMTYDEERKLTTYRRYPFVTARVRRYVNPNPVETRINPTRT